MRLPAAICWTAAFWILHAGTGLAKLLNPTSWRCRRSARLVLRHRLYARDLGALHLPDDTQMLLRGFTYPLLW